MLHIMYYTSSSLVTIVFGHYLNVTYHRQHIMAQVHCDVITLLYDVLCFSRDSIVIAPSNCCDVTKAQSSFLALTPEMLLKHQIFGILQKF